jgi:tRNA 2-thiocytidine biosynthesis protein TtcA
MLRDWDRTHPGRSESIFSAIKNVAPSQLADTELFNFVDLEQHRAEAEAPDENLLQLINL